MEWTVSVRMLVAFSVFEPDLRPGASDAMEAGRVGHQSRQGQAEMADSAVRREVSLKETFCVLGAQVTVQGRMDLYRPGDTPTIEEIKVPQNGVAPSRPVPSHWSQALCYAYLLCRRDRLTSVTVRLLYADRSGRELAAFTETMLYAALEDAFFALLLPFTEDALREQAWRDARDESIRALPFPFPAYRPGQREMAVQVYTAISRKKRLLCMLPTGTGKSAGVLYPALKALGEGVTKQIFYLTARTTTREAAAQALTLMRARGLQARCLVISSKEKVCPGSMHCHPDDCAQARGFFLRLPDAVREMEADGDWSAARVIDCAARHTVCPFEFSLQLATRADVVICDYNYAFDPMVRLGVLFDHGHGQTLLVDEAHNLPARARDMLSGSLGTAELRAMRKHIGMSVGRKTPAYRAFTALIRALEQAVPDTAPTEGVLERLPDGLAHRVETVLDTMDGLMALPGAGAMARELFLLLRTLLPFLGAIGRASDAPADYATLYALSGRERTVSLMALNISDYLRQLTRGLPGVVYFSATVSPMDAMLRLLGGSEGDALLETPSPFPADNLLLLRKSLSTRYRDRERTAPLIAKCLLDFVTAHAGKYLCFFPSYRYLALVAGEMAAQCPDAALLRQSERQDDASREAFLDVFRHAEGAAIGLAVLGGSFSEGIDLPGERLIGVAVVGVGLPMVCAAQETLRTYYDAAFGDGFAFAYRYPGMQRVLQAAGRVIRTASDRGAVLLIDDRYSQRAYTALLPRHYASLRESEDVCADMRAFFDQQASETF